MELSGEGKELAAKYRFYPTQTWRGDSSGTTEFSNGVKVHWAEGRNTLHTIEQPDGTTETTVEITPYLEFMVAGEYGEMNYGMSREETTKMKVTRLATRALRNGDQAQTITYDDGSKIHCYFSGGNGILIQADGTTTAEQLDEGFIGDEPNPRWDALQVEYERLEDDYPNMTDEEFKEWGTAVGPISEESAEETIRHLREAQDRNR